MTPYRKLSKIMAVPLVCYACWLGMMAVHEAGHVVHAWASGGRVVKVRLPLVGFSQTIVWPNPREHFVVWGGPVWGSLLPLVPLIAWRVVRGRRRPPPEGLRFFAGFCLIANGVYLGVGWATHAGDAGDLLRLGTPVGVLVAFGIVAFAGGMMLWHGSSWMRFR